MAEINPYQDPLYYRPHTWDRNIWRSVVFQNEYGFSEKDGRIPWLGDIVDIGGHIGGFSWLAAHKLKAKKIVVVEPDVENFRLLSMNLDSLIQEGRVEAINAGIGSPNKFLGPASHYQDNTGGNLYYASDSGSIPTVSLDQILEKVSGPVLLKLDCEGCEYQSLFDCKDFSKVECVIGEYHVNLGYDKNNLRQFFLKNNFAFSTAKDHPTIGLFGAHRLH